MTAPVSAWFDEDAHRLQRRRDHLLRPPDAVEVARDRAEAVVDRDVARGRILELLEHRVGPPRGEDVAGKQEHRQAVDGRERRAGDHVGRPRPDRASCRRTSRAGFACARSRRPRAPSPARCGPGSRSGAPGSRTAPRRSQRRCRGRRCRSSRRRSAARRRPARRAAPPGSGPAPAPPYNLMPTLSAGSPASSCSSSASSSAAGHQADELLLVDLALLERCRGSGRGSGSRTGRRRGRRGAGCG